MFLHTHCQEIQAELEALGTSSFEDNEEVVEHRAAALLVCLQILVTQSTFLWAKTPTDMCFKVLIDPKKRACFGKAKDKVSVYCLWAQATRY